MVDFYNLFLGTKYQSVFLSSAQELKQFRHIEQSKDNFSMFDTYTKEVLAEAERDIATIDVFSVCIGPGSYTGLRIALSYVKGLAYALNKPLVTYDYFSVLYEVAKSRLSESYEIYSVVLKAREGEFFICSFDNKGQKLEKSALLRHNICINTLQKNLDRRILISDAQDTVLALALNSSAFIVDGVDLQVLSGLVYNKFIAGDTDDIYTVTPQYLKEPYIKMKSAD